MSTDNTPRFGLIITQGVIKPYAHYENHGLQQEIVIEQLRALLNRFEKEYFDNFNPIS